MKQRFLSIFLALALIIPFFPQVTLPAKAAETTAKTQDEISNENTDAFGIKMDTTIDTKKEKANNPYGTEGWVNLFTVPELFVSQGMMATEVLKPIIIIMTEIIKKVPLEA